MRQKKRRTTLLAILLTLTASGCVAAPWIKEQIPNSPICRHLDERTVRTNKDGKEFVLKRPNPTCMKRIGEPRCGYCVWTLTDKEQYVGEGWNHLLQVGSKKKKWSTIQSEALTVPAETQAATKAFAINICRITSACAQDIDDLRIKFDALDSVGRVINR